MSEKVYIDANVFVYAVANTERIGNNALNILEKIKSGELLGVTSLLSIDEVMWALQKRHERSKAYEIASALMVFPNLNLVDITKNILAAALLIYNEGILAPRDAIHLATMRFKNIKTIITNDADFQSIKGIKRIKLE